MQIIDTKRISYLISKSLYLNLGLKKTHFEKKIFVLDLNTFKPQIRLDRQERISYSIKNYFFNIDESLKYFSKITQKVGEKSFILTHKNKHTPL